jgi:hypothetical protein
VSLPALLLQWQRVRRVRVNSMETFDRLTQESMSALSAQQDGPASITDQRHRHSKLLSMSTRSVQVYR